MESYASSINPTSKAVVSRHRMSLNSKEESWHGIAVVMTGLGVNGSNYLNVPIGLHTNIF